MDIRELAMLLLLLALIALFFLLRKKGEEKEQAEPHPFIRPRAPLLHPQRQQAEGQRIEHIEAEAVSPIRQPPGLEIEVGQVGKDSENRHPANVTGKAAGMAVPFRQQEADGRRRDPSQCGQGPCAGSQRRMV